MTFTSGCSLRGSSTSPGERQGQTAPQHHRVNQQPIFVDQILFPGPGCARRRPRHGQGCPCPAAASDASPLRPDRRRRQHTPRASCRDSRTGSSGSAPPPSTRQPATGRIFQCGGRLSTIKVDMPFAREDGFRNCVHRRSKRLPRWRSGQNAAISRKVRLPMIWRPVSRNRSTIQLVAASSRCF